MKVKTDVDEKCPECGEKHGPEHHYNMTYRGKGNPPLHMVEALGQIIASGCGDRFVIAEAEFDGERTAVICAESSDRSGLVPMFVGLTNKMAQHISMEGAMLQPNPNFKPGADLKRDAELAKRTTDLGKDGDFYDMRGMES